MTRGCLPGGAILWAASFAEDTRGPRERLAWAAARYRARFGRAHTIVAVPLAELDVYRVAGVAAVGDGRLARDCLYLLCSPDGQDREQSEEDT